ncbi:MAG TPA: hypothetical protein VHX60_03865 [Acidobacteriaceae bacterium]|jgi:hypothetical protein|nr:hypothetical protein [Acidobacteriaceae bacterium]
MFRECSSILPNGRKCRCAATRNRAVCRHHGPPPVPGPPPTPHRDRYSDLIRWRTLSRNLPWMPLDEIPHAIHQILQCLVDRGPDSPGKISDLTAGRYLRVLLTRLGGVPFADPDLALEPPPPRGAPAPVPAPADPSDLNELNALLAALAQHAQPGPQPPLPQSHRRVHQ